MEFGIKDFYTFLIEFAFCILFLIIFASIHYSINNVKKVRLALQRNKVGHFFYFFGFGALLSALSFVVSQLCTQALDTKIALPIIILGLIFTMSFFYDIAVGVGAIIPSVLWVVWRWSETSTSTNWDIWARLIVIAVYMLVSYALYLYKEQRWSYFIIGSIMIAGTIILCVVNIGDAKLLYHCIETVIGILITFLFLGVIKGINRMFTNITNIAINSVYSDQHYLVPESLEPNFINYIKSNHINQALVILFDFNDVNNNIVKQQLLDNIHDTFNKNNYQTLFFKTEYNKYGIVLSGKEFYINDLNQCFKGNLFSNRLEKDNLLRLQQIINSIPLKYDYYNQAYTFKIKAYVSVYGVHSNDINELINDDMFMLNNEDHLTNNVIKIFHSIMTEHIINDQIDYATLTQNINLDELTISLELLKVNNLDKVFVYPRVYWIRKMLGDYKSIIKTLPLKTANTLLRNLAIKAIELYAQSEYKGKYDLVINYPYEELNDIFYSVQNAIQKIKLFGIDPHNVIYCFDVEKIKEWPKNILMHLTEFQTNKIQYILLNVNSGTVFNAHTPIFATLSDNVLKNTKKLQKINKLVAKQKINVLSTINKQ